MTDDPDDDPEYPNDLTPCERCGEVKPLQKFCSAWSDKSEWLCADCAAEAGVEE